MKTRPGRRRTKRKMRSGLWSGRPSAPGRLWNPPAARSIRPRLLTGGLRPPWHSCGPARSRGNYSRPTAPSRWPVRPWKRRGGPWNGPSSSSATAPSARPNWMRHARRWRAPRPATGRPRPRGICCGGGARANVRQAESAAAAARARAEQAGGAVRAATARLARAQLRAPFDGVVTRVLLNAGSPVGPGVPVASLAAAGGWITADVDEADIGQVRLDQTARITADAYPGRTFAGRVTRVGRAVEVRLGTRVVRVRIDLDGSAGLRVGTSVDVQLLLQAIPDALLAPAEAVIASANDGAPHVFLIEGGRLRRRDVRTGAGNDEFIVILDGLKEGDLVAVGEPARLRDGLKVRVVAVR